MKEQHFQSITIHQSESFINRLEYIRLYYTFLGYFIRTNFIPKRSVPYFQFNLLINSPTSIPFPRKLEILHRSWLGVRTPNQFLWSISRVGYWIRDLIRGLKWTPGTDHLWKISTVGNRRSNIFRLIISIGITGSQKSIVVFKRDL